MLLHGFFVGFGSVIGGLITFVITRNILIGIGVFVFCSILGFLDANKRFGFFK